MGYVKHRRGDKMTLMRKLRLEKGMPQSELWFMNLDTGLCIGQPEISQIERFGFDGTVGREKVEQGLPEFAKMLGYEGNPLDLLEEVRY